MNKCNRINHRLTDTFKNYACMRLKFRSQIVSGRQDQAPAPANQPLPRVPKRAA